MYPKKLRLDFLVWVPLALLLAACGPTLEPIIIQETSVVVETVWVEREGRTILQEVTRVVEVEKPVEVEVEVKVEKLVTATPQPEPIAPLKTELDGLWVPASEPDTLDPQLASTTGSFGVIAQCFEGLFEYRGDGTIAPTGATGYSISEDGLVYTINLRQDALWSDRVPVVAQHYVDGVLRLLHPDTAAAYAWLMYDLKGAEAFNTGKGEQSESVGIRAIDDYTLEITLAQPTSYFDTVLPFSTFIPARLDVIEEHGVRWTEPGNYIGNGPYLLDSWDHEAEIVLVKNPLYHSADKVSIEKITMPMIEERSTSLALYDSGALHVSSYPSEEVPRILNDPALSSQLVRQPVPGVYYLGLNTKRPPTDNANVRRALAAAIDRQTILENVVMRPWRPRLTCTTPPTIMGYQEPGTCGHDFDPEKAQQYLADAGYPDGEGLPLLIIWYSRSDYASDVVEAIVAMWELHLNVQVEIRTFEWALYLDALDVCAHSEQAYTECEFSAYNLGWVMDYGDPQNQLEIVFAPDSPFQYTGWQNERYDELIGLAGGEFDQDKRAEYYMEADKILSEDEAVIIPLHGYGRATLVKPGVTHEWPPFGEAKFKHWRLP